MRYRTRYYHKVALVCLSLFLCSCVEVKQTITINQNGSGECTFEVAIEKMWASEIIPSLKEEISKEGWTVYEEKDIGSRRGIVFGKKFLNVAELNDDETNYELLMTQKSFMANTYSLRITQRQSSDIPFPLCVNVKMPGNIDITNGTKVSTGETKWDLQGLQRGTELSVSSSAMAFSGFTWLNPMFKAPILAGSALMALLIITGIAVAARKRVLKSAVASQVIFCTECGNQNSHEAVFCTNCGQKLR